MKKIVIILLFVTQLSQSQDILTFADCLNRAMQNNLKLKSASFDEKAAVYQQRASFGKLLPSVYGEFENRNSWGKEIDSDTNLYVNEDLRNNEGTLNAYLTLFSGFANLSSILAAKQELEMNRTNMQRIRNEISIDVARRFITILFLEEIITANEEQLKSSDKQLEMGNLKFNSGVISESELFKIKSQKASEELRLLTNQNQLNENLISLKQLMNMPLEKEIVLVKPNLTLNENVVLVEDQQSLADRAVQMNPLYKMSLLEQKLAKSKLAIARAPTYPTLTMRLLYRSNYSTTDFDNIPFSTQLDENTSRGIRFYLTIPIFSQFNNYGKIKASKMRWMQTKVDTQIERDRLSKEVLLAINNAKTSLKKNEASSKAFDYSQKSFDADALKFELGKININELNTSKIIFNNSQAELIQSKYELLFNNALIRFYLGEEFSL